MSQSRRHKRPGPKKFLAGLSNSIQPRVVRLPEERPETGLEVGSRVHWWKSWNIDGVSSDNKAAKQSDPTFRKGFSSKFATKRVSVSALRDPPMTCLSSLLNCVVGVKTVDSASVDGALFAIWKPGSLVMEMIFRTRTVVLATDVCSRK